MSSWSKVITNKGRQLQAKAQAGAELFYTRMAVGSGTLSGQSLEAMTALITPVTNLEITRLRRPPGTTRAVIGATLTNQTVTTGFFLREAGIYAMDPDDGEILYMYANCGATADYISPDGTDPIEKFLNYNVFVGSAANITANIDESLVYATKQELDEAIAGITIGEASLTEKGVTQLSSATNSNAEDKAATPKAVKTVAEAAMAAQTTANAANLAAGAAQTRADQAFQSGNERKSEVVAALVALGVSASTSDSWDTLISKMSAIIKATGNATAADVLAGKTFSNATGNGLQGTMPNRGAGGTVTPGTTNQTKAAGYYNSAITVLGDADLAPGNIKSGVNIFGVVGTVEPSTYGYADVDVSLVEGYVVARGSKRLDLLTIPAGVKFISFVGSASVSPNNTGSGCTASLRIEDNDAHASPIMSRSYPDGNYNSDILNVNLMSREVRVIGSGIWTTNLTTSFVVGGPYKVYLLYQNSADTGYTFPVINNRVTGRFYYF
ncbi:tail fiber protein [Paenibacillus antibioticophila]|uniref:tail fiber protein n=1 Tax=Paenibacillus antibioticophila TaxID=1274374 RepID=UPI0005CABE33|nr:tail fiber protein [Paenibacillus antibioticophila]